ncbi:MAG TPA: adenylate/guanylate cyclase domain-containing protein [Burkholderiales bacterium]|nr:adenylate/guanylate cyclase domain-containing protein [Burkholderiales bacterium]
MKLARRFVFRWLAAVVVPVVLAAALARTDFHQGLEDFYVDYWHIFQGIRYKPEHTVFVTVDDATLLALKDDPLAFWAPYWGYVIGILRQAGAKGIGLDYIYTVSAESWLRKLELPDSHISREYDAPLREALAQGGVILITHLVELPGGQLALLEPPQDQKLLLPRGLNDLGIANLYPDADKHVRGFYPVMDPDPAKAGIAFNMQLAMVAAGLDPSSKDGWEIAGVKIGRELKRYPIGYTGPPGTIPTISMLTLLRPDALELPEVKALKGKVVIIAANNAGNSDRHFTPYSRYTPDWLAERADQMAGGEIHANIIETILGGRYLKPLPIWLELGYIVLLVGIGAWYFLRWNVGLGAAILALLIIGVIPPAYLGFQHDWILPVAELHAGLIVSYLMTIGMRLTGEERERSRMRTVFGRYVADEVVDVLLADDRKPDLAGETKLVTVLFCDIRGFTTISEKLTAHEVVEMLNAYFTRVCEPILVQGGTVDKYIGDAVMAVFGSPVAYPDHARRAVRAALGMAKEAAAFKQWMTQRFPDRGLHEFGIGIGLHTGEAVIGDIGTPKRKEFAAIGDTVNSASRLEGVTKELKCVIVAGDSTVAAAGPGVRTGKEQTVTVKGRTGAIKVYEVVGIDE